MTEIQAKSDLMEHVTLRDAQAQDVAFIFSSWLKSFRKSDFAKAHRNEIYFDGHKGVLERVLKRSHVVVAASKDDPGQIYGWACFEERGSVPVIHYVYVKQPYRGFGLAKLLLGGLMSRSVAYSHECPFIEKLAPGSYYNPYAAFGRDE